MGKVLILLLSVAFFVGVTNLASAQTTAAGKKTSKGELLFPIEARSFETPDIAISGITSDSSQLFFVVSDRAHVIVTPFHGLKATREESFGAIIASNRHNLVNQPPLTMWQGIAHHAGRIMLLDGRGLRLMNLNTKDFGLVARRSIAWDLIKPPADVKGEPTRVETEQLRGRFRRAYQKAGDIKLSGLTLFDAKNKNAVKYLVATKIAGFPVTMMHCGGDDGSLCYLERACNVLSVHDLSPTAVSGVAYSKKRNLLLIGDKARQRILLFKFKSCFDVTRAETLTIPAKIKSLSNLYVDDNDRLWVVASAADDYLNASAYVWEKW